MLLPDTCTISSDRYFQGDCDQGLTLPALLYSLGVGGVIVLTALGAVVCVEVCTAAAGPAITSATVAGQKAVDKLKESLPGIQRTLQPQIDAVRAFFISGSQSFRTSLDRALSDPSRLDHIFEQERHALGPLVEQFGSRAEVVRQVLLKVHLGDMSGTERAIEVAGSQVWVQGKIIDGVFRLSDFWVIH
jgi:hypothetical protein